MHERGGQALVEHGGGGRGGNGSPHLSDKTLQPVGQGRHGRVGCASGDQWKVPTTGEACHIRRELLGSAAAWASGLSFLIITPENSGGKGSRHASGNEIPICRADHCRAAWGMIRRETSCVPLLWSRPPQSPPRSLATPGEDLQVLQTCSGPCRLLFCRAELRLDRGLDDELPPTASRPTTHAPRSTVHDPRPTPIRPSPFRGEQASRPNHV